MVGDSDGEVGYNVAFLDEIGVPIASVSVGERGLLVIRDINMLLTIKRVEDNFAV